MQSLKRIRRLILKAEDAIASKGSRQSNFDKALLRAYKQCAMIVEEETDADAPTSHEILGALSAFCKNHCFYSRKSGPGAMSECQICPIAPFSLNDVDVDEEDDDVDMDAVRMQRAAVQARSAMRRLEDQDLETNAAPERHVRRGNMGLQPADGDG